MSKEAGCVFSFKFSEKKTSQKDIRAYISPLGSCLIGCLFTAALVRETKALVQECYHRGATVFNRPNGAVNTGIVRLQ